MLAARIRPRPDEGSILRIVGRLPSEKPVQFSLHRTAKHQKQKRNGEREADKPPVAESANDANTGCEPDAGRAGQPFHFMLVAVNDYAGTKEADARQDALDDAARSIGQLTCFERGRGGNEDHERGGQPDHAQRTQPDGLAVEVAVQSDRAGRQRRDAEPQ